jgi:hypothetical protein
VSTPAIRVGEDRLLSAGGPEKPLVEAHLAVDPRNGDHMLAAAIVISKPDFSETDCAAFATFDGGKTWTRHDLGMKVCADPWTAINNDGSAVLAVLPESDLAVYRSADGGKTWPEPPVTFKGSHDHETMTVDRGSGALYVLSSEYFPEPATGKRRPTVFVARSDDGGRKFSDPVRVFTSNLNSNTATPIVLSDGTLVVSVDDFQRSSTEGPLWLERPRDWVLTSKDRGKTFSVPMMVSESCSRGFPTLSADPSPSGPFRDRLYWLCNTYYFTDVFLHYSPDAGESWSRPIRVNKGSGTRPYVRTPAIAINRDGVVGIAWYDARNERMKMKQIFQCLDLYFTASLDGGDTFLPDAKVTSQIGCADSPGNGDARYRWPAGGDYLGLAARPDGDFALVWADSRDGMYRLRTTTVHVEGKVAAAKKE